MKAILIPTNGIKPHPDYKAFYRANPGAGIESLMASLSGPNHQMQPILVDLQHRLIFGMRRLLAAKKLGWTDIWAIVVDMTDPVQAMLDENDCRLPFSVEERARLAKYLLEREQKQANERQKAGKPIGKTTPSENFSQGQAGRAKDAAAKAAGMSRPTMEKAIEVVAAADADPKLRPVVDEMNATGNVSGAHRKAVPPKPPKNGRPTFDDRPFEKMFGQMVRWCDDRAKAMHCKEGVEHKDMMKCLGLVEASFRRWQKATT